jgi:glycerophosphoryl diester phosphodiesterase
VISKLLRTSLKFSQAEPWPSEFVLPFFQAHRGFHQKTLENSLAALQEAHQLGFLMAEFDVRLSREGVPFLLHDPTLARTHQIADRLADLTADQAKLFGLTSLEEVLRCREVPGCLNLEFKSEGLDKSFKDEVRLAKFIRKHLEAHGLFGKKLLISSFNPFSLWQFSRLLPEVPRALLISDETPYFLIRHGLLLPVLKLHALHVDKRLLSSLQVVYEIKTRGYKLAAWTLSDRKTSFELLSWGVDSIICDPLPANQGNIFDGNRLR